MDRCKLLNFLLILIVLTTLPRISFGQNEHPNNQEIINSPKTKSIKPALIMGYQLQKNHFFEVGIGIKNESLIGHHQNTFVYGISNELKLHDDFIWGLKAGAWFGGGAGGINAGLNLINYTDFKNSSIQFRPEIGMGIKWFRVVYGYNFAISNKDFQGINKHNFSLAIILSTSSK